MGKKILHSVLAVLLLAYLAFAVAFMNPKASKDNECTSLQIEIVENAGASYLTREQVEAFLKKASINPVGKKMSDISTESIEKAMKENKLIKEVESYKTIDGMVKIKVYQRIPVLRILSETGNYYVDNEQQVMPVPPNYAAYVPVATGNISKDYAKNQLYLFADYLRKNKYWNEQIEQIHILSNLDVELIPRTGNHCILLGQIEDYKENLNKLKLFYDKGLNKVGWNKYSAINLKYKNQVVCTKRE
jgi:cell division protein FtsQ